MDFSRAILIVGVALVIVVLVNVAIFYSITRRKGKDSTVGQIELLRRAAQRARDPWESEHRDLDELSRRVADLKKGSPGPGEKQ